MSAIYYLRRSWGPSDRGLWCENGLRVSTDLLFIFSLSTIVPGNPQQAANPLPNEKTKYNQVAGVHRGRT